MIGIVIYGMATWRVASMFVNEAGPGDLFIRMRELFGITHDSHKQALIVPEGFLPSIFSCVWCCSVWVGVFWMIFDLFYPWLALRLATALAFSAVAIMIHKYMER